MRHQGERQTEGVNGQEGKCWISCQQPQPQGYAALPGRAAFQLSTLELNNLTQPAGKETGKEAGHGLRGLFPHNSVLLL